MVYQLAYISRANGGIERSGLLELLTAARERNLAVGITGVLLYREGRFLQLLEGSAPAVGLVYRSIVADPRHTDVCCVQAGHGTRWFSEWSMGFRDLTDEPLAVDGYVNLLIDAMPEPARDLASATLHELWDQLRPTPDQHDQHDQSRPDQHRPPATPAPAGRDGAAEAGRPSSLAGLAGLADNVRRGLLRTSRADPGGPHPAS